MKPARKPTLARVAATTTLRMYEELAQSVPQFARGMVWCPTCGHSRRVDSARCLAGGWPMCCGQTMTIDSPEERRALAALAGAHEATGR